MVARGDSGHGDVALEAHDTRVTLQTLKRKKQKTAGIHLRCGTKSGAL